MGYIKAEKQGFWHSQPLSTIQLLLFCFFSLLYNLFFSFCFFAFLLFKEKKKK